MVEKLSGIRPKRIRKGVELNTVKDLLREMWADCEWNEKASQLL